MLRNKHAENSWTRDATIQRHRAMTLAGPHYPFALNCRSWKGPDEPKRPFKRHQSVSLISSVSIFDLFRFCMRRSAFLQPARHVLLATRVLSRRSENAGSLNRTLLKPEDSPGGQGKLQADASNDCTHQKNCRHQKRSVRYVSRNPETDIVSLPWRRGRASGAGPGGRANHRAGGPRHSGGRLRLLLLHHVDGRVPQAIHQRGTGQGIWQRPDEHVRQRARISTSRF